MPTCTKSALAETNVVFGLDGLNEVQQKALMIYLNVLELAAVGGTDYSAAMTTTLIADATALVSTMNPNQRRIALLNIAYNNAVAAGATVPTSIQELNAATGCCFQNFSDLDAILILLACKLGKHTGT
jgi:hypothetical protein